MRKFDLEMFLRMFSWVAMRLPRDFVVACIVDGLPSLVRAGPLRDDVFRTIWSRTSLLKTMAERRGERCVFKILVTYLDEYSAHMSRFLMWAPLGRAFKGRRRMPSLERTGLGCPRLKRKS